MKLIAVGIVAFTLLSSAQAQKIRLSGTIYDPNGAVVVKATINARSEKGQHLSTKSNDAGEFEIDLYPGIHALEVAAPGFLAVKYSEYLVVNTSSGMKMDFVIFGGKYHEPCGYSGGACLPAKSLIESYQVKYVPTLKEIRNEFSPETKPKKQ